MCFRSGGNNCWPIATELAQVAVIHPLLHPTMALSWAHQTLWTQHGLWIGAETQLLHTPNSSGTPNQWFLKIQLQPIALFGSTEWRLQMASVFSHEGRESWWCNYVKVCKGLCLGRFPVAHVRHDLKRSPRTRQSRRIPDAAHDVRRTKFQISK
jgi:hypothetical protein